MQEQGLTCAAPVHIPPSQGSAGSARHRQPEMVLFFCLCRTFTSFCCGSDPSSADLHPDVGDQEKVGRGHRGWYK